MSAAEKPRFLKEEGIIVEPRLTLVCGFGGRKHGIRSVVSRLVKSNWLGLTDITCPRCPGPAIVEEKRPK